MGTEALSLVEKWLGAEKTIHLDLVLKLTLEVSK
jgi:hypothetical protein